MINKLICWLFGHKKRYKMIDKIWEVPGFWGGVSWSWHWQYWRVCPRCGKLLVKGKEK
jgi:hypothetical protein